MPKYRRSRRAIHREITCSSDAAHLLFAALRDLDAAAMRSIEHWPLLAAHLRGTLGKGCAIEAAKVPRFFSRQVSCT